MLFNVNVNFPNVFRSKNDYIQTNKINNKINEVRMMLAKVKVTRGQSLRQFCFAFVWILSSSCISSTTPRGTRLNKCI